MSFTCPYCGVLIESSFSYIELGCDFSLKYCILSKICPECGGITIKLEISDRKYYEKEEKPKIHRIYPKFDKRGFKSEGVPEKFLEDYNESVAVLDISPKASSMLSRCCLENLLGNHLKIEGKTLKDMINNATKDGKIPENVKGHLHTIRSKGNVSAHIKTNKVTNSRIKVTREDAVCNIFVLECLFSHYFIQPMFLEKRKKEWDTKIENADKPSTK